MLQLAKYPIVNEHPEGFPRLSVVLNSDPRLLMHRRFGKLHCRRLLHLENELTELEKELDKLDRDIGKLRDPPEHVSRPREGEKLHKLMATIHTKLIEYDKLLLKDFALRTLPQPRRRDHRSLFDYIINHKPLALGEYNHIFHVEDFVTPKSCPRDTWIDDIIRLSLQLPPLYHLRVGLAYSARRGAPSDSDSLCTEMVCIS